MLIVDIQDRRTRWRQCRHQFGLLRSNRLEAAKRAQVLFADTGDCAHQRPCQADGNIEGHIAILSGNSDLQDAVLIPRPDTKYAFGQAERSIVVTSAFRALVSSREYRGQEILDGGLAATPCHADEDDTA